MTAGTWAGVTAVELWESLTLEAHELLLSSRAGAPIVAPTVTVQMLVKLGLITPELSLTDVGVHLVVNR